MSNDPSGTSVALWIARAMRRASRLLALVAVSIAALTTGPVMPQAASAAPTPPTFMVNATGDAPADFASEPFFDTCRTNINTTTCTLRAALMNANRFAGGGAAIIVPSGVYTLTIGPVGADDDDSGDLNITQTVTIAGAGAASTIIDAAGLDGVFQVSAGVTVTISGVTIRDGTAAAGNGSGVSNSGTLTLNDLIISGNSASSGGGLDNFGMATLNRVTIKDNQAVSGLGGGIYNAAQLTVNNSTLSNNQAALHGGGIYSHDTLTINKSTLNANHSGQFGGGIYNKGTLTMNDSTLSANTAEGAGGGLRNIGTAAFLYHVTIAGNLADASGATAQQGGGIANSSGPTLGIWNSLLAENYAGTVADDCSGPFVSHDYNYVQTTAGCTINGVTGHNLSDGDAFLGPLQDNGGPTPTRALLAGSPALDQIPGQQNGPCTDSFATAPHPDQRGVARPINGLCDIGAYEGSQPYFAFNRNLVRNGDAESGGATPSVTGTVGLPNWTVTAGNFTAVQYNQPGFPNTLTDAVPANHGHNFFAGGDLPQNASAQQFITVTAASTAIDAQAVRWILSADLGGWQAQEDSATARIQFLDEFGANLAGLNQFLPVSAAERNSQTGFVHRSLGGTVPAGTRLILIGLNANWTEGYNDGYIDNVSLVLQPPMLFLPFLAR